MILLVLKMFGRISTNSQLKMIIKLYFTCTDDHLSLISFCLLSTNTELL